MADPTRWEHPDPAEVIQLDRTAWDQLLTDHGGVYPDPLARCLEVARASGAVTAVLETRYVDLDYRSEFAAFYSRAFAPIPNSARRLHFFTDAVQADQLWELPENPGYLGYIVLRPSALGSVERAVLAPPPGFADSVRCSVTDHVNVFGRDLSVTGTPFTQQDTQLGRCAHAAAWMCHFSAVARGDAYRLPMAEFSLSADPAIGLGRPLPSEGLTVQQLLELFRVFELPAVFYDGRNLPEGARSPWSLPDPAAAPPDPTKSDLRLIPIICRYLNSGYPVMVATNDHVFVITGYERQRRPSGVDWITFIRSDDQRGPYLTVDDITNDTDASGHPYGKWEGLIVPLPEKLWLTAEAAERTGAEDLEAFADTAARHGFADAQSFLDDLRAEHLALRTYAVRSNDFKTRLVERGLDPDLIREYRLARFSRLVWIVEAVDRRLRASGEPCVVGEAVYDATSSSTAPKALIAHVPGLAWVHRLEGTPRFPIRCTPTPYASGGNGPP